FFSSRSRHTRFSRDWSSDVCSSDLETQSLLNVEINEETVVGLEEAGFIEVDEPERKASLAVIVAGGTVDSDEEDLGEFEGEPWQIGRASCRESWRERWREVWATGTQ